MNKKLFLGMFAAAGMLLATSCSNDELDVVQSGNEAQVTFNLGTEGGIATRAISDGTGAKKLVYAVYKLDADKNPVLQKVVGSDDNSQFVDEEAFDNGLTETVSVTLAKGQTYQVAFWAQNPECTAYTTTDLTNVGVSYENANNNDETRDAFFKTVEFTVNGSTSIDVTLKRPFAQINVGVTAEDWEAAVASGITIEKSSVVIKNAANQINLLTGEVSGSTEVNYASKTIPNDPAILKVDADGDGKDEEYNWLSMSYILVADATTTDANNTGVLGDERTTLEGLQYTFTPASGNAIEFKEGLAGAPVQRNWRTNILGKILTGDIQFNITIDPAYDDDIIYPDGSIEQELEFAATFGGEVTLPANTTITLHKALNVTADMILNLNGSNIEITAAYDQNNYEASSAIVNNAKLTLTGNGTIKATNNYTVRNNGTMIIDGVTIQNGIMNFNDLTIESGNISNSRTGKHAIYGNNAKLTINGGQFHNENPGNATVFAYAGEVVINDGEFSIADGTSTQGWTSCVIDAQGNAKYTINGGTIKGEIRDYNNNTKVYGGTFTHNSVNSFVADGYTAVNNGDGTWTVCKAVASVQDLKTALADGGNIALTDNIDVTDAIVVPEGQTATIDLNGKTIKSTTSDAFVVNNGGNLTISGKGKVESNGAPIRAIGGKVIVEGGEFTQTGAWNTSVSTYRYSVDSREGGEIIIKGGTFTTNNGMINVSANSSIVIEGGNFKFENNTGGTRHFAYVSGNLTINDGEFCGVADSNAGGCFFCGAATGCNIQINGGKFKSLWTSNSANKIFEAYNGGTINVTGGLFNTDGGIESSVVANTDDTTKNTYPWMAK